MARRSLDERDVRKLTRMGNQSLGVTIPIEIIRDLKLREKQKVVVKQKGKSIVITDWKK